MNVKACEDKSHKAIKDRCNTGQQKAIYLYYYLDFSYKEVKDTSNIEIDHEAR